MLLAILRSRKLGMHGHVPERGFYTARDLRGWNREPARCIRQTLSTKPKVMRTHQELALNHLSHLPPFYFTSTGDEHGRG